MIFLPETLRRWELIGYNKEAVIALEENYRAALESYHRTLMTDKTLDVTPPMTPLQMLARIEYVRASQRLIDRWSGLEGFVHPTDMPTHRERLDWSKLVHNEIKVYNDRKYDENTPRA